MNETERLQELRRQHVRRQSAQQVRERRIRALSPQVRRGSIAEALLQAGLPPSISFWLFATSSLACGALFAFEGVFGRVTTVLLIPAIVYICGIPAVQFRRGDRRRDALAKLPSALDEIVVILKTGQSLEVALEQAADSLESGVLKHELKRVVELIKLHVNPVDVFVVLSQHISGPEIESVALCFQMGVQHSGQLAVALNECRDRIVEIRNEEERRERGVRVFQPTVCVLLLLSLAVLLGLAFESPPWLLSNLVLARIIRVLVVAQMALMAGLLRLMQTEEI